MITDNIRSFVEGIDHAFVASSNGAGSPHLAAGRRLRVADPRHLIFEAWFCYTTLENLTENPAVAIAVADREGNGYQFIGRIVRREEGAILDGYAPDREIQGMPQVESRLHVMVERVMAFSAGAHTDQPL